MKVLVTTPFKLNLGIVDGLPKEVEYAAGTQDMPEDHFKHWWAQTNKVKSLENDKPQLAPPVAARDGGKR
jgi:hypothetical protein